MDGRHYSDIARQLNKDGVLSPTLQRKFYKTGEKPLPESKLAPARKIGGSPGTDLS